MHVSVLKNETIDGLSFQAGDIFLDGTLNGGGHSVGIAERFGSSVRIIGIDLDRDAIERAGAKLSQIHGNFVLYEDNFRNLDAVIAKEGLTRVSKILFDLGWSSDQMESDRGFSFQKDEPLLMTYVKEPKEETLTAKEIVMNWDEEHIADIIFHYGEEPKSRRIAKAIVVERKVRPIETTGDLVRIIEKVSPRRGRIHPATKTFQALRITVNDEIGALKEGLAKAFLHLGPLGRLAVISFHSIEDRIVKQFFAELKRKEEARILSKKPINASTEELSQNPRARSAKLRIIEKIN